MTAAYPLRKPLSFPELTKRLERFGKELGAIRCMRSPREDATLRILVKDNIGTDEFPTTAGALCFAGLRLPDAFCVRRLKAAGCDVFGKTNMTELAGFVTTALPNRGYSHMGGMGKNPHGDFPPGGSSSGSAIAVAAGLCDAALGTETRGSLMDPGLACGVWAFKPSRGLISRSRVVPLSASFDTVGVLARDVATVGRLLGMLRGYDPEDPSTEAGDAIRLEPQTHGDPVRIGLLAFENDSSWKDSPVLRGKLLEARLPGIEFVPVEARRLSFDYKLISSMDIISGMDRFLRRYGNDSAPRSFAELLRFYREHAETHPYGMDRLEDAAAMQAPSQEELSECIRDNVTRARDSIRGLIRQHRLSAIACAGFTDWWAIAGAPSVAVPVGKAPDGRPVGMMLGAEFGADGRLLQVATMLEAFLG